MTERESAADFRQRRLPYFADELERSFEFLPYSDLKRWLPWNGFLEKALENLPLRRLEGIRSLSFLSYIGGDTTSAQVEEYTHDRLHHSLVVPLVGAQILKRNGFSQEDINIETIAGLTHDNGMPAYGDATKKVDPDALDEEKNYWESLGEKGQVFIESLGMSQKLLEPIVRNEGILGQVLDIADRITYTMQDLHMTGSEAKTNIFLPTLEPRLLPIRYLLSHDINIGDIYKEVGVDRKKNEVFFNDPKRLHIFLLLRAHLHQMLYLNPINQGRDLFVKHLIEPLYSRDGLSQLNPKVLRNMTDKDLLRLLQKQYGKYTSMPDFLYHDLKEWRPCFKKFDSYNEAKKFEEELRMNKDIAIIDKPYFCKGFNPATSYKVVANEKGDIEPFNEFFSYAAREAEDIAESTKGIFVFYTDVSKNHKIGKLLKAILMSKSKLDN